MKRILTFFLLLTLFSSCKSPMSNLGNEAANPDQSASAAAGQLATNLPPAQADSLRKVVWQEFKTQNGSKWRIRWSKTTGLPVSVWLGETKKAYTGSAEQAARAFLADYQTLFGFASLNQLKFVRTQTNRGASHVTFNQTVNGVPVYDAEFKVHIRQDGHVGMANGYYYPNIKVSTTPGITASDAGQTAQTDLGSSVKATVPVTSSALVIYRDQKNQFHLAWKLILVSGQPLYDWLYFVDAQSGQVIDKLNQLMDVTGDGDVYPTDPNFSSVTDESLYRLNGSGYLRGTWAYSVNDATSNAYSSNNSFQYSPGNTHFDEANLYWHIDQFRANFINTLDNGSLTLGQIEAHAHATIPGSGDLNARFCRDCSPKQLDFGDASSSSSYNDFAKDDKVIYHEYSHAVIYHINSGIESTNNEEGAISEGTPDYFAGAYTGRAIIGDYCCAGTSGERDMANPQISSYSQYENESPVEAHLGGEFFSSILWDVYNDPSIGEAKAKFLAYDALFRITSSPTFLDFRDAMMASDDANYSGADDNKIQDTFASKGVGNYSPLGVTISGPSYIQAYENGTWTASASGGTGSYSYTWYHRHTSSDPWSYLGTGSSVSTTDYESFELKVDVTDNSGPKTGTNDIVVYVQGSHP